MNKKVYISFLLLIGLTLSVLFLSKPPFPPLSWGYKQYSKTDFVLGTVGEITVVAKPPLPPLSGGYKRSLLLGKDNTPLIRGARGVLETCFEELKRIENKFSVFKKTSEIYKLNNRKNNTVEVSDELSYLLKRSIAVSQETNGAFDVTILPLIEFWKTKQKDNILPLQKEINGILKKIGYDKIKFLSENKIQLPKGMKIDLGGIAKGYAIKRCADILKKNKIENFLINIGGDIYAQGYNKRKKWKIGIENPDNPGNVLKSFPVLNKVVFTSGSYHRFFKIKEKKYSHIIDPKTGWPANHSKSITIIGYDPVYVDGVATAVSVMDREKAVVFLEEHESLEYNLVS